MSVDSDRVQRLRRQVRLVAILDACESAGTSPLPAADLHLIAYFADALAPVWGLRIVDPQLLKRQSGPLSPLLQRDIDLLVGRRVLLARDVRHQRDQDRGWRLDARYLLNRESAGRILSRIHNFPEQANQLAFVREVVFAISALGVTGMSGVSRSDAAYGNELVDTGGMVDIARRGGEENPTARVALQFGKVMQPTTDLAPAEMIHLYVRELYGRIRSAA